MSTNHDSIESEKGQNKANLHYCIIVLRNENLHFSDIGIRHIVTSGFICLAESRSREVYCGLACSAHFKIFFIEF